MRRRCDRATPHAAEERRSYRWFYDHLLSRVYDFVILWLLLPCGGERRFRRHMMAGVEFAPGERIIDLCCGTGSSTLGILEQAPAPSLALAADLSIGQLRRAKPKLAPRGVFLMAANAARTPLPSAFFDSVLIAHALHEMPRATRLGVLREARRLLRPGGQLVVLDLDNPPSLARRLLLGAWIGYWLPYPINFENRTRRDMLSHGVQNEVAEAGFVRTQKSSLYEGAMQVVIGWA